MGHTIDRCITGRTKLRNLISISPARSVNIFGDIGVITSLLINYSLDLQTAFGPYAMIRKAGSPMNIHDLALTCLLPKHAYQLTYTRLRSLLLVRPLVRLPFIIDHALSE